LAKPSRPTLCTIDEPILGASVANTTGVSDRTIRRLVRHGREESDDLAEQTDRRLAAAPRAAL
jgi:hypothetical protein